MKTQLKMKKKKKTHVFLQLEVKPVVSVILQNLPSLFLLQYVPQNTLRINEE